RDRARRNFRSLAGKRHDGSEQKKNPDDPRSTKADFHRVKILCPRPKVFQSRIWIVVSIGIASLSKHRSFPRKRESSPSAAHFQWLADEIPAFAGMTSPGGARSSQMTPLPE